ncbi:LysR family transcriptional regulator [Streptococcus sp. 121]|uniref:LysR family transcriptional regulator n=1 Tax=Streptococcus sp. 121 TaxID=2797637 RepID=UPI0018F09AEF|nr:LysR family transcriptional regulator [Streptococcus sp. 121]MBJ6746706.1 LysR family transcriptional regulator [Streptococcus sp. 121]
MNLDWYYTFLVLSKHLNYHKASAELFLTEPTLHQQIKKLEKYLQVKLFETVGRNLTLTQTGQDFIPIAQKIISTHEEGVQKIRLKDKKLEDKISIVVSPYIANYLLPKFLPTFFERYPSIDISITVLQKDIAQTIEKNQFDIGIAREEPFTTKINIEKICEGKIALFFPKEADSLSEIELFKKYKILSDNHPIYWSKTKQEITNLVPEAQFTSIHDISITEKLIGMGQGISLLPLYLTTNFNPHIGFRLPEKISTPVSFTYMMNRKESKLIKLFKQEFKIFIDTEQSNLS